jgi:hypothetical protein
MSYLFSLNFLGLICYFIYIYIFYFLERGRREWSGGAGSWRQEGVWDLSAVTVLHDHKQWLVGQLVRYGRAVPSGPAKCSG